MKNFKFNTLYIIESLREGEAKTGQNLYDDMHLQIYYHEGLDVQLHVVQTTGDWNNTMQNILDSCQHNGVFPIIHLELHGYENGIQLTNGDLLSIDKIGEQFRQINIATGCNLFLTLGVCKGLYLLFSTHYDKPMPFCGVVGSFEVMRADDIQLRYGAFYGKFFETFDVGEAYAALKNTETNAPEIFTQYRYIQVDEIFLDGYQRYIREACASSVMDDRALQAAAESGKILQNRSVRRKFQKEFRNEEKKRRLAYFNQARKAFYMLDLFPENAERFDVPKTFEELAEKCKHLVTI